MSSVPAIVVLIVALGVIGRCIEIAVALPPCKGSDGSPAGQFPGAIRSLLVGLVGISLLIMMLAILGVFSVGAIALALALLAAGAVRRAASHPLAIADFATGLRASLASWLAIGLTAACLAWFAPPFDARLASVDASIYLGAAAYIADAGQMSGPDPLVASMTTEERIAFFANRFRGDSTGPYARFPGGVPLLDLASGTAGFYFYHLWPVWLALGAKLLGQASAPALLSMFAAIGLAAYYWLGRQLAGRTFGLAAAIILAASLPQTYYMRVPLSEVPSQALFLAGLAAFAAALQGGGADRRVWQWLAAALWGAFCLMRADGVLYLVPALALACLCCADIRRSFAEWLPLTVGVLSLAVLAFLHQVAGGVYSAALVTLPVVGEVIGQVLAVMDGHARAVEMAWVAMAAVAAMVIHRGRSPRAMRMLAAAAIMAFALATIVWMVRFVPRMNADAMLRHVHWIAVYVPSWLLTTMGLGVTIVGARIVRDPRREQLAIAMMALLVIPLASFIVDPWVSATQPWAARRLVPMILPLLFMLALLGWRVGLGGLGRRVGRNLAPLGTAIALVVTGYFLTTSWFLWGVAAPHDTHTRLDQLAARIPANAIVVLPDEDAGMHLQVALQYGEQRAALLMPFAPSVDDANHASRVRYLQRIADTRPVIILVPSHLPRPEALLNHFQSEPLFDASLSVATVKATGEFERPRELGAYQRRYSAFRLRPRSG